MYQETPCFNRLTLSGSVQTQLGSVSWLFLWHIPRVTPMEQLFQAKRCSLFFFIFIFPFCFFFCRGIYSSWVPNMLLEYAFQIKNDYFYFSNQLAFGPSDSMPRCRCFSKIIRIQLGALFSLAFLFPQYQVWIILAPASRANFGSFVVLLYLWWSKGSCHSLHRALAKIMGVISSHLFFIFNFSHLPWTLSRLPALLAQVQVSAEKMQEQKDVHLKIVLLNF